MSSFDTPKARQQTLVRSVATTRPTLDLPGISVTTIAPEPWWPRPVKDWVARRICKYEVLGEQDGRFPWLLSGRLVATGPDHEPIVELHEPIAMLTPRVLREAKQWYQRRFEVGQDSTE